MIKTLIKLKAETSDWPDDVLSEEEKQEYLQFWMTAYGIVLNPEKIHKNVGLRSLIKLFLVAFWGKFA